MLLDEQDKFEEINMKYKCAYGCGRSFKTSQGKNMHEGVHFRSMLKKIRKDVLIESRSKGDRENERR